MLDSKIGSSKPEHKIVMDYREKLCVSGIKEIISFDDKNISVQTICGELVIEGENLRINALNVEKGDLDILYFHQTAALVHECC